MSDEAKYRHAYAQQKANAKRRGIAWELTYDQWRAWWGDDIDKRGSGKGDLQMQRFGDSGPYALHNVRKGTPAQNSATWGRCVRNRNAQKAARDHEAMLDALMWARSEEARDDSLTYDPANDVSRQMRHNGTASEVPFLIDK